MERMKKMYGFSIAARASVILSDCLARRTPAKTRTEPQPLAQAGLCRPGKRCAYCISLVSSRLSAVAILFFRRYLWRMIQVVNIVNYSDNVTLLYVVSAYSEPDTGTGSAAFESGVIAYLWSLL